MALPNNVVYDAQVLSDTSVWAATASGLARIIPTVEQFSSINASLSSNHIFELAFDSMGTLWGASEFGGVVKLDSSGIWQNYTWHNSSFPDQTALTIHINGKGDIWAGSYGGLSVWEGTDWLTFNTFNSGLPYDRVNCITTDIYERIWIGTDSGLVSLDTLNNWTLYDTSLIPDRFITRLLADPLGGVWIGTWEGLAYFDGDSTWTSYESLSPDIVLSLELDWDGNLWTGIYNDGLYVFEPGFDTTHYTPSKTGFPVDRVFDIHFDDYGNTWLAIDRGNPNNGGGLLRFDGNTGWKEYVQENSGLASNRVRTIAQHKDSEIWSGTWSGISAFTFPCPKTQFPYIRSGNLPV